MYQALILADSISPLGKRLTTMQVTFPRIILSEFNTHRMFSRNSASSRAIPIEKRIAALYADPFIPEAFCSNKAGMQAGKELSLSEQDLCKETWLSAMQQMIKYAERLIESKVHKQWVNRLLEPFCWNTTIVSATEWENFFALRNNPDAQPEIHTIAGMMESLYRKSTPKEVDYASWHLPFIQKDEFCLHEIDKLVKISVARCARISYLTHDGRRDPDADLSLYTKLLEKRHMSPFEHAARPMTETDACIQLHNMTGQYTSNFKGWIQHRKEILGEDVAPKVTLA